jgi:hypothetical protein
LSDPRVAIAVCALVGVIATGIGVGGTLLFVERGPEGARGEQGPAGAQGPPGDAGPVEDDLEALQGQVDDIDSRLSDLEFSDPTTAVDDLDSRVSDLESALSDLCFELDLIC